MGHLKAEEVTSLERVLYGDVPELDTARWKEQGLRLPETPAELQNPPKSPLFNVVLQQTKGGPCGVLAAIQGFMIHHILEHDLHLPVESITLQVANEALVAALAQILVQAVPDSSNAVTIVFSDPESPSGLSKVEIIENEAGAQSDRIKAEINSRMESFLSGMGTVLFVYSVLLTRTLEGLRDDMDEASQSLMQRFGHTSQELVNLVLCGRAVSNIHDGDKVMGEGDGQWTLKGIPGERSVGFLTTLEALRYTKVGSLYKTPKSPVWVVGSANHYTVVFALDKRVAMLSELQKREMHARTIFNELDPMENGFFPTNDLETFCRKMGFSDSETRLVASMADRESMGIVLWESLWTAVEHVSPAPTRDADWSCSACTFINSAQVISCEMCGTAAPAVPVDQASTCPHSFTLYHINGMSNYGGQAAEISRVNVSQNDTGISEGIQQDVGLRQVLQTRWTFCIVDYLDGEPRIT